MMFNLCIPTVCSIFFFFLMIRRPPRSTQGVSSAASDVYKRQEKKGKWYCKGCLNSPCGNDLGDFSRTEEGQYLLQYSPSATMNSIFRLPVPITAKHLFVLQTSRLLSPQQTKLKNNLDSRVYRISIINSSVHRHYQTCLLYTSPSPRDLSTSRMPSSA
eukprot:TRINITY_DN28698_c0_g1_i2.p1 TRINITY_DN28698_c0_g1~~TRINITY_DN28698_c0_g1_i2.p1  ORF type:complete len:159 (-),score=24.95 TRINITY_DN28698_c0_g1_i2:62-538(-)